MELEQQIRHAYWVDLGTTHLAEAEKIQERLVQLRKADKIPDVILQTQHHPTITFGKDRRQNGFRPEFLMEVKARFGEMSESAVLYHLRTQGISFHAADRGGGSTYLGPGQAVFYPVVDYEKIVGRTFGIGDYKALIDGLIVATLNEHFNIPAQSFRVTSHLPDLDGDETRKNRMDIWLEKDGKFFKIGSKGIHISGNVAYYGFSVYVSNEGIRGFNIVSPCGYTREQLGITSMEQEIGDIDLGQVVGSVRSFMETRFRYEGIIDITLSQLLAQGEELEA